MSGEGQGNPVTTPVEPCCMVVRQRPECQIVNPPETLRTSAEPPSNQNINSYEKYNDSAQARTKGQVTPIAHNHHCTTKLCWRLETYVVYHIDFHTYTSSFTRSHGSDVLCAHHPIAFLLHTTASLSSSPPFIFSGIEVSLQSCGQN